MIVVGVTGHQDIPEGALAFVEKGITGIIRKLKSDVMGVSSLAAGADQLFAKAILQCGGRLHVVIPCVAYDATFAHDSDRNSFCEILEKAEVVETLQHVRPSHEAFWEAGCRVVDLSDVLVAIWDGKVSKGKGGTADIVQYARKGGIEIIVVWPPGFSR